MLFLLILAIFLTGFVLCLLVSFIDFKISGQEKQRLIIEFPTLRIPKLKSLFKALQKFIKGFIIKLGITITLITAFLYILRSVSTSFTFLPKERASESVLYAIADRLKFVFAPLKITDTCFVLSAICGLFAKEGIVSTLSLFEYEALTFKQTLAFLTFCYLYPPCLSAIFASVREAGKAFTLTMVIKQTVLAVLVSYSIFNIKYLWILLLVITFYLAIKSVYEKVFGN